MDVVFILTEIEHRNCEACADCADRARNNARVTGSVGATWSTQTGHGRIHSATIRRSDHYEPKEK